MGIRFVLLVLTFTSLYGLLGFQLYKIQIINSAEFSKEAEIIKKFNADLALRRGQVFFTDRNQKLIPVSQNRDKPVIFAGPEEIKDPQKTSKLLAATISFKEEALTKILSKKNSRFEMLVEEPTKEQIDFVNNLKTENIKGIHIRDKQYRYYPYQQLGSHLLGFVGVNETYSEPIGLYGIEKFYNEKLTPGGDIKLTIDQNLQAQSEQILQKLIEEYDATGGTIIIQEPTTGKILTLANAPDFNPNQYSESPVKNFLNPAVQYVYEPGSVFKPLTMATGIETGALTPETIFNDSGSVTLNGKTIKNWDEKAYGKVTMTNVIERSINTGAVYAQKLIGNAKFYEYLKKFGFAQKTDIDLPDETNGSLKNLEKKDARPIDFATASFGQGTAVTPLQLANAFSAIANGGLLMKPYVNAETEPSIVRRVISKETAEKVTKMMVSAVEKAQVAAIPSYRVAGKTGTAQIPNFQTGGYTEEFIHSYVGFAPASAPRFVILIKLDKPNATLAGVTVVPAFRELAQFVLTYYNVPPDNL